MHALSIEQHKTTSAPRHHSRIAFIAIALGRGVDCSLSALQYTWRDVVRECLE